MGLLAVPGNAQGSAAKVVLGVLRQHRFLHVQQLVTLTGLPPERVWTAASRLVERGLVRRLSRGVYAAVGGSRRPARRPRRTMHQRALMFARLLLKSPVPFLMTGYYAIGANLLGLPKPERWPPHLIYLAKDHGELMRSYLTYNDKRVLFDPPPERLKAAFELFDGEFVILRERSIVGEHHKVRRAEGAWVDLLAERRVGYPIALDELAEMLARMADDPLMSWSALARAARRRGFPLAYGPDPTLYGSANSMIQLRVTRPGHQLADDLYGIIITADERYAEIPLPLAFDPSKRHRAMTGAVWVA